MSDDAILVFGGSGQVGAALRRDPRVLAPDRAQCDLRIPGAGAGMIRTTRARAVINAAAFTAVDAAEDDPAGARAINAMAPAALAEAAAERGLPFVHISTDYVFDGSGAAPRRPADPTAPLGVYGATKRAGETGVIAAGGRAVILRTSWVFSAHGSNFVRTMLRLSDTRDTLGIVADQVGGPTPAADIARACLHIADALCAGAPGGVYHFSGAPDVSWAGFAREIFRQAGRAVTIDELTSAQYPQSAMRPLNSRLDCTGLAADFGLVRPDWKAGLRDVLNNLEVAAL